LETESYDAFISYARADARHAKEINALLCQNGVSTFFDNRNLISGLPWLTALEEAIGAAKAVIVLIGPHGLGNTQQYERELALVRQTRNRKISVIPVLLPGTRDPPVGFLQLLTWVDFASVSKVSDAPEEIERLLGAVKRRKVKSAQVYLCPYRGLDAFREEDAPFFFGRGTVDDPASDIGKLVGMVREHSFVMVVGRSGSGKSSLVNAGLMPALRRDHSRVWDILSL
jgi:ABC-type multidrug transport system fused ATPase/permease subunit